MCNISKRDERRATENKKAGDQRNVFQVDRDRLLYSLSFRRLAEVTQVVSAGEGNVFHNRLTHSLKVSQVARRIAETLIASVEENPKYKYISEFLNPDVVEAAALAHDLGHPPFGHVAEKALDLIARDNQLSDGFEGNAQTFRILTRLEPHRTEYLGLDLTRATLNATIKYPWYRARRGVPNCEKRSKKFSIYDLDRDAFNFVRPPDPNGNQSDQPTLEAKIMELADDITYSVHDLEDFYLAGLIPLDVVAESDEEFQIFYQSWCESDGELGVNSQKTELRDELSALLQAYVPDRANSNPGSTEQLAHVRRASSILIQSFVQSASLTLEADDSIGLNRAPEKDLQMKFLQHFVRRYIIDNPKLATQQWGQQKIVQTLFREYLDAISMKRYTLLPARYVKKGSIDHLLDGNDTKLQKVRLAVDIVASMNEAQAVLMFRRLTGVEQGSIMDYIS
jgi:dGTPase